jgi:hypothetical protein
MECGQSLDKMRNKLALENNSEKTQLRYSCLYGYGQDKSAYEGPLYFILLKATNFIDKNKESKFTGSCMDFFVNSNLNTVYLKIMSDAQFS